MTCDRISSDNGKLGPSHVLRGCRAIADHLEIGTKRADHLIRSQQLPTFRHAGAPCATTRGINDWRKIAVAERRDPDANQAKSVEAVATVDHKPQQIGAFAIVTSALAASGNTGDGSVTEGSANNRPALSARSAKASPFGVVAWPHLPCADSERPVVLMGCRAIAERLNISTRQADHLIRQGKLPTFRRAGAPCATQLGLDDWRELVGHTTSGAAMPVGGSEKSRGGHRVLPPPIPRADFLCATWNSQGPASRATFSEHRFERRYRIDPDSLALALSARPGGPYACPLTSLRIEPASLATDQLISPPSPDAQP